jgi:shikimate kinase
VQVAARGCDVPGVVLVGYRACGKSYLARYLGQSWQLPALDADELLEQGLGRRIPELFASEGEAVFRDHESRILQAQLAQAGPFVFATGGGVVEHEANRQALQASPHLVVYQHAPIQLIRQRLQANSGDRPSLSAAGLLDEVPDILRRRDPWYRAVADLVVEADDAIETRVRQVEEHLNG